PYEGQFVKLYFDGAVFQVPFNMIPRSITEKYPALETENDFITITGLNQRHGHTVVHFFHTGNYQYIVPRVREGLLNRNEVKLNDALRIYEFATSHSVDKLAFFAFNHVKEIGNSLKLSKMLIMMHENNLDLHNKEGRLVEYLMEQVRLPTVRISREDIDEVEMAIPSRSVTSIMLLDMLEMKLSLQKYKEDECRKTSIP
ncbi:hypothetical protein NW768_001720, partial [Fusarium equiseti]